MFSKITIFLILTCVCLAIFYFYNKSDVIIYEKTKPKFKSDKKEIKHLSDKYTYMYTPHDIRYMTEYLQNMRKKRNDIRNEQYLFLNLNRNNVLDDIANYDIFENDQDIQTVLPDYLTDDKQNIHDSFVQKQSKNGYKQIEKGNEKNIRELNYEIKSYIKDNKLYCETKMQKILNIIDKIQKRNTYISNFSDTEYNILCNTWNSGNNNVKIQLLKQLEECLDSFGNLYCPTGVTTRIIESSYIENPEFYPKPKNIINQEILHKTSALRKEYPDLSTNEFKVILIEHLYKDYSELMTKNDISKNISEWIEYI